MKKAIFAVLAITVFCSAPAHANNFWRGVGQVTLGVAGGWVLADVLTAPRHQVVYYGGSSRPYYMNGPYCDQGYFVPGRGCVISYGPPPVQYVPVEVPVEREVVREVPAQQAPTIIVNNYIVNGDVSDVKQPPKKVAKKAKKAKKSVVTATQKTGY